MKPSLTEIHEFLAQRQALIVHCSGTPKGIGPGQELYPADLTNVWAGHAQGGISCSVVQPGDQFHGPGRHTTGSVGLVIAPTESNSLVAVDPRDAGSHVVDGIRTVGQEVDIDVADLERCFSERGAHYNEWVIRDFQVIGVFVGEPATTWQRVQIPMPHGMPPEETSAEEGRPTSQIAGDFRGLPILTLANGEIRRWTECGWTSIAHSEVYRAT